MATERKRRKRTVKTKQSTITADSAILAASNNNNDNFCVINALNFVKASFNNDNLANVVFGLNTTERGATSNNVFFANIERSNEFNPTLKYNKNCLLSVENNISENKLLIHNLYRSDECFFKSAIYLSSKSSRSENTYDFLNITTHKLSTLTQLSNVVLTDGIFYALLPMSNYGRYNISCDIYSWISANNGNILPPDNYISTVLYNKPAIKKALEDNDIDALLKNSTLSALTNINYNMIYEIPAKQYNDFESGNILANSFKCKNAFNSLYDMSHTNKVILQNARNYNNVGNCNKQVYLTYKDNINYANENTRALQTNLTYKLACELVELLGSMNRYANLNGHKTNLYSIAVYSDIFNCLNDNNTTGKTFKDRLKQEVLHVVKDIVDKLAPINTLLLSTFVNEIK